MALRPSIPWSAVEPRRPEQGSSVSRVHREAAPPSFRPALLPSCTIYRPGHSLTPAHAHPHTWSRVSQRLSPAPASQPTETKRRLLYHPSGILSRWSTASLDSPAHPHSLGAQLSRTTDRLGHSPAFHPVHYSTTEPGYTVLPRSPVPLLSQRTGGPPQSPLRVPLMVGMEGFNGFLSILRAIPYPNRAPHEAPALSPYLRIYFRSRFTRAAASCNASESEGPEDTSRPV